MTKARDIHRCEELSSIVPTVPMVWPVLLSCRSRCAKGILREEQYAIILRLLETLMGKPSACAKGMQDKMVLAKEAYYKRVIRDKTAYTAGG